MKSGTSSLNPYAAPYIPLSRRGTDDANNNDDATNDNSLKERGYMGGNDTIWSGPRSVEGTKNQYQSKASQNCSAHDIIPDEEYDMDLAYLQMTYPGISYESLSAVYGANKGDLDATIDMLNHFELDPDEYSENLMHAFEIGDVSELGSPPTCSAALKLKKVADEIAGLSYGASESAHATT